jgi:hypothetical protein
VNAPPPRVLLSGRIVALLLIGVVALGLGLLDFAEGETVSVPAGAKAGDLTLESCTYPTENGLYDADCGTLVVAEHSADAASPLIALPVVRVRARSANPNVETLLVSGELDFVTPPQTATNELLPYLPNGREVVLDGIGHNFSFWYDQPEATSQLVNTFFASGQVGDSLYSPQPVVFTPSLPSGRLARIVVGVLVALTTLMAAPLIAMARHVRRRGGFGPIAAALLRSLHPILAGLRGWSLGALIVLATPDVPLVNQPLAVLSIGIPVGLGIWLAWVPPDRKHSATPQGLVGALAGALLGGWLGFHAGGGFTSVGTTVIGAIAGANLALILFELWRACSVGTPPAVPPVDVRAPEPAPPTPIGMT